MRCTVMFIYKDITPWSLSIKRNSTRVLRITKRVQRRPLKGNSGFHSCKVNLEKI